MVKKEQPEKVKDKALLFVPAGLLIGLGIGFATSLLPGLFIGLGTGILVAALIKNLKR